ncbi:hypothetical protein HJ590_13255 [Naumannella sp. ID2617S]|nr:hypothetical protein [Naumannella sp. ID2617S]
MPKQADHAREALGHFTDDNTAALVHTGLAIADAIHHLADVLAQEAEAEATPITCSGVLDLAHKLRCPIPHPLTETELNQWTHTMPAIRLGGDRRFHLVDNRGGISEWCTSDGVRFETSELLAARRGITVDRGDDQ